MWDIIPLRPMFLLLSSEQLYTVFRDLVSDRPAKPWEGVDYFDARNSDYNIDLAEGLGQFRDRPSLHQAASLSGIPGKIDVSGDSVAQMWLDNQLPEILAYNEFGHDSFALGKDGTLFGLLDT